MTFDALKFVITTNIFQLLPVSSAPTSKVATHCCQALFFSKLVSVGRAMGWS